MVDPLVSGVTYLRLKRGWSKNLKGRSIMSKFGTLAIARFEEEGKGKSKTPKLTVLQSGFEKKSEATAAVEDLLKGDEEGNTLQIIRLDSKYQVKQVTETRIAEVE